MTTPETAIRPASPRALEVARTWPLLITQDVATRLSPEGLKLTGWQFHVRCGWRSCGQSVFCAGNDSGAYIWSWRDDLAVGVLGHIYQCHREGSGVDAAESLPGPLRDARL